MEDGVAHDAYSSTGVAMGDGGARALTRRRLHAGGGAIGLAQLGGQHIVPQAAAAEPGRRSLPLLPSGIQGFQVIRLWVGFRAQCRQRRCIQLGAGKRGKCREDPLIG